MKRLVQLSLFVAAVTLAGRLFAAIHTEKVTYKHGGAALEGYLAYDDAVQTKRPGILIFPEWWGLNDYPKKRAEQLAASGYVAFAADIYGKGKVTTDPAEAGKLSSFYKGDRQLTRGRAAAALKTFRGVKQVDDSKIAAIGYCFGGTCALELARAGTDIIGVASFHGGLDTPAPADAKNIKGKILVMTGGDDNYVPEEQRSAFIKEMRDAKVDWQMNIYSGAVHAFTNPNAGNDPSKGMAYNASADKRSWQAMIDFFNEIFGATH